jgi:hypothetical protein
MEKNGTLKHEDVLNFLSSLFGNDLHAKRVLSLSDATVGLLKSGSMAIHTIGEGLSQAKELHRKHAVKQVDRLLGNQGIDLSEIFPGRISYLVGKKKKIMVAFDWTDFDKDKQTTIMLNLITNHGHGTPLM